MTFPARSAIRRDRRRRGWRGALFALLCLGTWALCAAPALAFVYGNPTPNIAENETGAGVSLTDDRITGFLDFGVSPKGVAQGSVALIEIGRADGVEVGAGYRHRIDETLDLKDQSISFGVIAFAHYGDAKDGDTEITYLQLDVGFGGSLPVTDQLVVFGAPVFRRLSVEVSNAGRGGGRNSDSDLGLYAGLEYWLSSTLVFGGELHFGFGDEFDEDFGIFAEFKF